MEPPTAILTSWGVGHVQPFSVPSSELDYRASCSDAAAFWRDAGGQKLIDLHASL
jgi:hypothetical protein